MRFALAAALLSFALVGCGGGGDAAGGQAGGEAPDPGAVHIHGLAVDADGTLLVATHGGLYRVAEGSLQLERVGPTYNDTMGLAVLGERHYLASGHPPQPPASARTPSLGVIESRDGGESWEPIALEGEVDLHAIRVAGDRIYGADALEPRLFVSEDGGRTWDERPAGAFIEDVAARPGDPDVLVAAGRDVLLRSEDGGRSWAPHGDPIGERVGVLAWPEPGVLLVAERTGGIWRSADEGLTWRSAGAIEGGVPVAILALGPEELYVALDSGEIRHSRDGGRSWRLRARS